MQVARVQDCCSHTAVREPSSYLFLYFSRYLLLCIFLFVQNPVFLCSYPLLYILHIAAGAFHYKDVSPMSSFLCLLFSSGFPLNWEHTYWPWGPPWLGSCPTPELLLLSVHSHYLPPILSHAQLLPASGSLHTKFLCLGLFFWLPCGGTFSSFHRPMRSFPGHYLK